MTILLNIDGVIVELSPSQSSKFESDRLPSPPSRADVDAAGDQRIRSGFIFAGKHYQYDAKAQKRITGAAAAAHIAITMRGKSPTDPKWHQQADEVVDDFKWIATDNSHVPMDAQTVIAFGLTAANWESKHVFAGDALKNMDPIPQDYATNESYWT